MIGAKTPEKAQKMAAAMPLGRHAFRVVANGDRRRDRVSVGDQVRVDLTREVPLDARQAGELLGVKASTIAAWAREGRLPCLRLGSRVIRFTTPMLGQLCDERLDPGRSDT
jgi:excisionase family DNA binding protein